MKILENSRQMPKDKKILANKGFYDLVYGYLQSISQWDGNPLEPRYILKKDLKFTELAKALGVSRQTVSTYFHKMVVNDVKYGNKGYPALIKESNDRYELIPLDKTLAMLVPKRTLIILVSALNEKAISIYVYLLNRYLASGEQKFQFTKEELREVVGISTKSHSNGYLINGILFVLKKLGLLNYIESTEKTSTGYKTFYYVTYMTNSIEEDFVFEETASQTLYEDLLRG